MKYLKTIITQTEEIQDYVNYRIEITTDELNLFYNALNIASELDNVSNYKEMEKMMQKLETLTQLNKTAIENIEL